MKIWQKKAFNFMTAIPDHNWPPVFSDSSSKNKEELITLAKSGAKRPRQRTRLGQFLCNYTNKNKTSYDPEFDKLIRSLRTDWFA